MKTKMPKPLRLFFITVFQVGFIFGIYAAGAAGFKLPFSIPYGLRIAIWLVIPTIAATVANYRIIFKTPSSSSSILAAITAIFVSGISLYLAMFLSLNTYGA